MRYPKSLSLATALLLSSTSLLPFTFSLLPSPALAQATDPRKTEADRLFQQGIQQHQTRQYEAALKSSERALVLYRALQDRPKEGDTLTLLGSTYLNLEQYQRSIDFYQQALVIFRELKDRGKEGNTLNGLGIAYRNLGDPRRAIDLYQQALSIAREVTDRAEEGRILGSLGVAYDALGDYRRAIDFHQQRLMIARELKDRSGEGRALGNLGAAYRSLEEYQRAIQLYQQRLVIDREQQDRQSEQSTLNTIARIYDQVGQPDKATAIRKEAEAISQTSRQATDPRKADANRLLQQGIQQYNSKEYDSALTTLEKAYVLFHGLDDFTGKSLSLLFMGLSYEVLGKYQQSLGVLRHSLFLQKEQNDRPNEPTTYQAIDRVYRQSCQLGKVSDSQPQTDGIFSPGLSPQAIAEKKAEAERLIKEGDEQSEQDQPKQAIVAWLKAQLLLYEAIDDCGELKSVLTSIGTAYARLAAYEQGLAYFEQARPIVEALGNKGSLAVLLTNQGAIYQTLSRYEEAIAAYEKALALLESNPDDLKDNRAALALLLNNLGGVYEYHSRYEDAIAAYEKARPLFETLKDYKSLANLLTNQSHAYYSLGLYQNAITVAEQALTLLKPLNEPWLLANVSNSLGNSHSELAQYKTAIDYYNQALTIYKSLGSQNDLAKIYGNVGLIYANFGDYKGAIAYYEQALNIHESLKTKDDHGLAVLLGNLGRAYVNLSEYEKALTFLEKARVLYEAERDRKRLAGVLSAEGIVYFQRGDLVKAEKLLFQAVEISESIRADLQQDAFKVSIFEEQTEAYRTLQQVLIAQGKVEQALEVAERGRARAFVELLWQRISPPPPLAKGGAKLTLQNPPFQGGQGGSRSLLAQTPSPAIKPIAITEIKQIAKDQNATLVQYSIIPDQKQGESLYIWVVKPSGQIAFQQVNLKTALKGKTLDELVLGGREDIGDSRGRGIGWQEDTATVNQAIAQVTSQANQQPQRNPNLQALHEVLITPIAKHLPTDPNQRVIFVPQGRLFVVPFPALQTKDGTYLIEQHTMLTAPAIEVLQLTRSQRQRLMGATGRSPLQHTLVVGNPLMPPLSFVLGQPPRTLASLPESAKEATAIAPLLNTTALLGKQATKATVVKQMQTARLIHLATHGIYDSRRGLQSGVVLAADGTGQPNDGLLTAGEILDMKLQAELVVLSACDTGQGEITGDGVIGLSRSIISAGVPSVLVSLWAVDDGATSELMQAFYRQLQQPGIDKAQALRQAMLATRAKHPGVAYWAAFTLIGEAE